MSSGANVAVEVERTLRLLFAKGDVFEVRAPKTKQKTISGYFDDPLKAARAIAGLDARADVPAVYATLNPVQPSLLARSANRLKPYADVTTGDNDIVRRRKLLVDADPVRPAGISSTDAEHEHAIACIREVYAFLRKHGVPDMLVGDSGNGAHINVAIDLPNDEASRVLCEHVLKALAFHFSDDRVKIDVSVANAGRVSKCYGTMTRTGDETPERPHRRSCILHFPKERETCSRETLEGIVALMPREDVKRAKGNCEEFGVDAFLERNGISVGKVGQWNGGRRWILDHCVFNESHGGSSAAILQHASGALSYSCLHDSCRGRKWTDVRERVEPGFKERQRGLRQPSELLRNGEARDDENELPHIITRNLSQVETRALAWLWGRRIVRGAFGLLGGLPGVGKSFLLAAIVAAVTTGLPLPGETEEREPADVILLALEDDPETVLRPRFEKLRADLDRVHLIEGIGRNGRKDATFSLKHVALLDDLLDRFPQTALLGIDPIASRLGGVDTWRSNDVRAILDPFLEAVEKRGVTTLAIAHATKSREGHAVMKIEGSLGGFVGRARFLLGAGRDDDGRCALGLLKSNYGPTESVPVVGYTIDADTGDFSWGDETTLIDAAALFSPPSTGLDRSATEEARDAIIDALRGSEILAADLARSVRAAGVQPATFFRVRAKMRAAKQIERLGGGAAGPVRWRCTLSHPEPQTRTLQSAKEYDALRKKDQNELAEVEL